MKSEVIGDGYEVLAEIGKGAYGVVYRCREASLGKIVAVKMLTADNLQQKVLDDFFAEGKKLAALNHPNVVHVHRAGMHQGRPYLVMEHVEGKTIRQLLAQSTLSLKTALSIMAQVAEGLRAIHHAGIVHRDLSTNNVMVSADETAKILDLGLARFVDSTAGISTTNRLKGTLYYIAPEVVDGQRAGAEADIFAFGVLLYETISGHNPFEGESARSVLYNIVHREPPPLEVLVPGLPPRVLRLVSHCLQKNPADRLAKLEGVSARILDCLQEVASDDAVPAPPPRRASSRSGASANPYHNRSMIRHPGEFVGRSAELRRIYSRLNASPPGCISIVGDRRIGKSSLLNFVSMPVNRDTFLDRPDSVVMVFLDLQEHPDIALESFVDVLLERIRKEAAGRIDLPRVPGTLDGMKEIVRLLCAAGFRLAILLDEFEMVTSNKRFPLEFYSFLRFLANQYDVGYITSSTRDLQVLCHTKEISDSPFFNIFSTMKLVAFGEAEARMLVCEISGRAGVPLEHHYQFITEELAGHFPLFLQIACSHLFDVLQEKAVDPDLAVVKRRYCEEVEPHYRYVWSALDDHERTVIEHVLEKSNVPESLRDVLVELGAEKFVVPGSSRVRVFSGTFERFLRAETGRMRRSPFWRRMLRAR